jgi:hypothetical protein
MEGGVSMGRLGVRQKKREVECALRLVDMVAPSSSAVNSVSSHPLL